MPFLLHLRPNYISSPQVSLLNYGRDYFHELFHNVVIGLKYKKMLCRVRSIISLLMQGFPSNLNDTYTSTRGCAEPMLPMCQLKVKVTVKGQIFNKQILHIMPCQLYNSFTNGRISFKLE